MMSRKILICTDMDRTLLPNGRQPESASAPSRFARLVQRPEVALAYVTGRHRALVETAIEEFGIPVPDFVLGDVGTSIYSVGARTWHSWSDWQTDIAVDWAGMGHEEIAAMFRDLTQLEPQEKAKQNRFKVSYYLPPQEPRDGLLDEMQRRLTEKGVNARLIWSVDEMNGIGLLDIIPARATKRHAIEFLMARKNYGLSDTVFAGDSGNDIPVLVSPIRSVLVANASNEVRREALRLAAETDTLKALYLARGSFLDMNGNYRAGILEGVAHYLPETLEWFI